jgi:hypothetical protein
VISTLLHLMVSSDHSQPSAPKTLPTNKPQSKRKLNASNAAAYRNIVNNVGATITQFNGLGDKGDLFFG